MTSSGRATGSPNLTSAFCSALVRPRCEPDPLDSTSICTAAVRADDRHGISHFFGRNKKATHTIPDGIFPLLCRTHYQEKQYRWNDNIGALAGFQCDCVLKSLERMAGQTWTDDNGIDWPFWCGFELQMQKYPDANNARSRKYFVPTWLEKLCKKEESGQDFVSVGERGGARYDFVQLVRIVNSIKTWCIQNNTRLPNVEALPITVGLVHEAETEEAKRGIRFAGRDLQLATMELRRPERKGKVTRTLQDAVERAREGMEIAEIALEIARDDGDATRATVPVKRIGKKRRDVETLNTGQGAVKRKTSQFETLQRKRLKAMDE